MKIVQSFIIFLCFVNLIQSQNEVDDINETELIGDSGWWSRRITKINKEEKHRIGLASEDNEKQSPRRCQEKTEIRDPRRRPRPFASAKHSTTIKREDDRFYLGKDNFRNDKELVPDLNVLAAPSPILRPPYATHPSLVYRDNIFDKELSTYDWNNESSLDRGNSSISSTTEQMRINEVTTLNSTKNETVESESSYEDDSSRTLNENNEKNRWMNFPRDETYDDKTRNYKVPIERRLEQKFRNSFHIDEKLRNGVNVNFEVTTNRNNRLKSPRGNRRYQDNFKDLKSFMRKQFYESDGYDWRARNGQRSNHHFRFSADSKIGSVPGIPGRDYPIHQEHTHHHLRNTVDRFPCPRTLKTHVYLADRASRCQIFYVCYGSMTGVPMVCPNGTLFSEPLQVCDWWFNVAC